MQISTLDSYKYSNNTTVSYIWAREIQGVSMTAFQKNGSLLTFNSPLAKSSQQRKTARHCKTPMKSNIVSIGSYVWLFLLDFSQTEIAW